MRINSLFINPIPQTPSTFKRNNSPPTQHHILSCGWIPSLKILYVLGLKLRGIERVSLCILGIRQGSSVFESIGRRFEFLRAYQ
jgi:hypothetical protein